MMKASQILPAAASLILFAASAHADQVRIDCGDIDVIIQEDQAQVISEVTQIADMTGAEFAAAVCDVFKGFNPADYKDPTAVKVVSGDRELEAEIQASQQ